MNANVAAKRVGMMGLCGALSVVLWGCNLPSPPGADRPPEADPAQTIPENPALSPEAATEAIPDPSDDTPAQSGAIYRNQRLGLQFPIPDQFQIQPHDQGITLWTNADYPRRDEFIEEIPLSITVRENPDNLPVREWVARQNYLLEGAMEDQPIGQTSGIRFTWQGMWEYTSVAVVHPSRQTVLLLTWDTASPDYEAAFDAIVANLAFLE